MFYSCSSLASVTIPEGVTIIENQAFQGCSALAEIDFPQSLVSLGCSDHARQGGVFQDCVSLKSVIIPDSVTSFSQDNIFSAWMFKGCTALEEVVLPKGALYIDDGMFYECVSLKSVTIPDTVTMILGSAFLGCSSLTEIVLPASIESMGTNIFWNCDSLKAVYYKGNKTDWENVKFTTNTPIVDASVLYFYCVNTPKVNETGSGYDGNYWHYDENGNIVPWVYNLYWSENSPVSEGVLIKPYDESNAQYNETLKQWEIHKAVDVLAGGNGYFYAPCAGTVKNIYENYLEDGVLEFESADGMFTFIYKSVAVNEDISVGDTFEIGGELLGTVDNSMMQESSYGAHLHFEMTYNGRSVDPALFFDFKTAE